jgi:uncharacterized DUF497 family protein
LRVERPSASIAGDANDQSEAVIVVYFIYQMRFEFDAAKSAANKSKHGIDFVEAQALWNDPDRMEGPGRSTNEPRFLTVGRIGKTTWTATVTYRHEETIRIISVRRARADEKEHYEEGSSEVGHR